MSNRLMLMLLIYSFSYSNVAGTGFLNFTSAKKGTFFSFDREL